MIHIDNFISLKSFIVHSSSSSKEEVLQELAAYVYHIGHSKSAGELLEALLKRETLSPTVLAPGAAIPHAMNDAITEPTLLIMSTKQPVLWHPEEEESASLFFMIALPQGSPPDLHLSLLSMIAELLEKEGVTEQLIEASDAQAMLDLLYMAEKAVNSRDAIEEERAGSLDLVAVTACPTGIAHTYMAADALKKEAKALNLHIEVETNGSSGPKNILTEEMIKQAKAVIIASDRDLDLQRFTGKKLYSVSAGHTVRHARDVIIAALKEDVPTYNPTVHDQKPAKPAHNTGVYGQLMTGVSYMLPFVVGGGILIALSFLFGIDASNPASPHYNILANFFNTLGAKGAFALMVPILAGYIGFSIGERPALMPAMVGGYLANSMGGGFLGGLLAGFLGGYSIVLLKKLLNFLPKPFEGLKPVLFYPVLSLLVMGAVLMPLLDFVVDINQSVSHFLQVMSGTNLIVLGLLLGGMMAVDMGGPVNKAAFTFGIAAIQAGNNAPHAAVMAGGMVPPLAVALATTLFRYKFSREERESGLTCYALGASFITEGAIPFAASQPMAVIPACVVGSSLAGALSMLFKATLPAPHGGIFVFPLVHHAPLYALAIAVGSVVSALLIGLLWSASQKSSV